MCHQQDNPPALSSTHAWYALQILCPAHVRAVCLKQDGYIVVSFSNATLVFEIGEEVKETSSSGFLATVATLHTQLLEDGSILQVSQAAYCSTAVQGAHSVCCGHS